MSASSIPTHKIGGNGPAIPRLGFGMMNLAGAYGKADDDEERLKLLDRAYELGDTFWDTAILYGDSEALIGKWFQRTGKRNEIFLATKFGIFREASGYKIDSSPENCRKCCEASLKVLGVDTIDLYYVHRVDPETPIEKTMRELVALQGEGKIRQIGLCGMSSTTLRRAHKIAPIAAVQVEYSPFDREVETARSTDLLKTCRELGVTVVCYSPLGRGLLTETSIAKGTSESAAMLGEYIPRFNKDNMEANIKLVEQFKAFADKKGCTTSQLAIAWLLKQGNDIIPIPGTRKIKNLESNWASLDVNLTDADEAELRKYLEGVELAGYRSVPGHEKYEYADTKEET